MTAFTFEHMATFRRRRWWFLPITSSYQQFNCWSVNSHVVCVPYRNVNGKNSLMKEMCLFDEQTHFSYFPVSLNKISFKIIIQSARLLAQKSSRTKRQKGGPQSRRTKVNTTGTLWSTRIRCMRGPQSDFTFYVRVTTFVIFFANFHFTAAHLCISFGNQGILHLEKVKWEEPGLLTRSEIHRDCFKTFHGFISHSCPLQWRIFL